MKEDGATATQTPPQATAFSLRTIEYLAKGQYSQSLGETDGFWAKIKIYAGGGENALHAHFDQAHSFVVLEGQMTYYDRDGTATVLNKYEGVMIPRGVFYRFESTSEENLVMLRFAAGTQTGARQGQDGEVHDGKGAEDMYVAPVPIPGKFFGS